MALHHLLPALVASGLILFATATPDWSFSVPQGALEFAERVRNGSISKVDIKPGPGFPSLESLGFTAHDLILSTSAKAKAAKEVAAREIGSTQGSTLLGENKRSLEKRSECTVPQPGGAMPHPDGTWACYLYLLNLGTTACAAPPPPDLATMCTGTVFHGDHRHEVVIHGQGACGGPASSYCGHVAQAVNAIIGSCTRCDNWPVGPGTAQEYYCGAWGLDYAYGNGCLRVHVRRGFSG